MWINALCIPSKSGCRGERGKRVRDGESDRGGREGRTERKRQRGGRRGKGVASPRRASVYEGDNYHELGRGVGRGRVKGERGETEV